MNAIVQVGGDVSEFDFNLGLDGCMSIAEKTVCGGDLTRYLPIWVLNGTITLSDLCSSKALTVVPKTAAQASAVPVAPKTKSTKAKAEGDGCCGDQCDSSSDCTSGLFCCPNHNECMDTTTEGTCGPNCQACGGDPCATSNWAQLPHLKKCSSKAPTVVPKAAA